MCRNTMSPEVTSRLVPKVACAGEKFLYFLSSSPRLKLVFVRANYGWRELEVLSETHNSIRVILLVFSLINLL